MLGSDRGAILTIVGIGAVLALLAVAHFRAPGCFTILEEEPEAQRGEAYEGQVTCNADCQVFFSKPGVADDQSDNRQPQKPTNRQTLEQLDLCAQERMAHWTAYLGWFTALGTILLFMTLREAFKGTRAAEIAAQSAENTVEAYKRTERAWIFPSEGLDANGIMEGTTNEFLGYRIQIRWKNTGRTPAIECRLWSGCKLINPGDHVPDTFIENGADANPSTIGPGMGFSTQALFISLADMKAVAEKKKRLIVWGLSRYRAVFDQDTHETQACFEISTNAGPSNLGKDGLSPHYFNIMQAGKHNKAT